MNEIEFREWASRFEYLDADQTERFFQQVASYFNEHSDMIRNMNALEIASLLRKASEIIGQRTGD